MKKFKSITKRLITLALLFTIIIGQIPEGNGDGDSDKPQGPSIVDGKEEQ